MAFRIMDSIIGGQPIAGLSTTVKHALGEIVRATDPTYGQGEFIYLSGAASTAVRNWGTYNLDDGSFKRLAADDIGPVCVAMAAITTSYYGWFQISGKALGTSLTDILDDQYVWIAGAGVVDDQSVAGDWIHNAKTASSPADDLLYAEFEISRPWIDNLSNTA